MSLPTLIAYTAEGLPLGSCIHTSAKGWKFLPFNCAHQGSRRFWQTSDECLPPWAERQSAGLLPVEDFNAKFPKYALKNTKLPLTSPSTVLAMTTPVAPAYREVMDVLKEAEEEIRRLHEIHADAFEGKIGEPDLEVANKIKSLRARLEM